MLATFWDLHSGNGVRLYDRVIRKGLAKAAGGPYLWRRVDGASCRQAEGSSPCLGRAFCWTASNHAAGSNAGKKSRFGKPFMQHSPKEFKKPPVLERADGRPRQVGFELEFSGLSLEQTVAAVRDSLDAKPTESTAAESRMDVDGLGEFSVEIDWNFLKRLASERAENVDDREWLETLSKVAAVVVPVEVVCPPIAITDLGCLHPMIEALRKAGAVGTDESFIAAYGVHINPEIPKLDAATLDSYLKAFALLQWWLVEAHEVDTTRQISPYIDLYGEAYLKRVLARQSPSLDDIASDYLEYNPTRNRALDLLPLLAEIDAAKVQRIVKDPKIKARPTFHYRMPNCHIERPDWSLATSWNKWCVVEELSQRPKDIEHLTDSFLELERPVLGINRNTWVEFVSKWLTDQELV